MSFSDEMREEGDAVERQAKAIHSTTAELTKQSIQFGSTLTGSPGQPVDEGALRSSWMREDVSDTESIISSNMEYARPIEDGIGPHGPLTLRSAVGGFGSVNATVNNFDKIVDAAVSAHRS